MKSTLKFEKVVGFLLLLMFTPAASVPASVLRTIIDSDDTLPVDVRVYVESLCPFCRDFMTQLSSQAPSLAPIMSLQIFPYGNAHPSPAADNCTSCTACNVWECNVTCQHGTQECKLNLAEACLLNFLPSLAALPAIKCIEHLTVAPGWCIAHHAPDGAKLATEVGKCMRSPLGRSIQEEMATATLEMLNPPKQYVPWVTVDGAPLLANYKNFAPAVCQAYKNRGGNVLPSICNQPSLEDKEWGTTAPAALNEHGLGNQTVIYIRCRVLKVLGSVCVSIVVNSTDASAVSLGVVLDFKRPGLRIELPLFSSVVCISDRDLLVLMLLIPELKPFDDEIRKLIKERGMIPAEVFSECLELSNVTGSGRSLSGCLSLESRLMCFKAHCVYKASDSFGCFHPQHGPAGWLAAASP